MPIRLLKVEYPEAMFYANMADQCWVTIKDKRYDEVEWDEDTCLYRVKIDDVWYYLAV